MIMRWLSSDDHLGEFVVLDLESLGMAVDAGLRGRLRHLDEKIEMRGRSLGPFGLRPRAWRGGGGKRRVIALEGIGGRDRNEIPDEFLVSAGISDAMPRMFEEPPSGAKTEPRQS